VPEVKRPKKDAKPPEKLDSRTDKRDDGPKTTTGPKKPEKSQKAIRKKIPQGLTQEQFDEAGKILRKDAGHLSDDIAVQGSRASHTAKETSDIDFAVKVPPDKFDSLIKERFGTPNPGSAKERTMQHAIKTGKIQAGEAGLRKTRKQLQKQLGMKVDLSIIKNGGTFDKAPYIQVPK
jgi:predicted nucleotidyltransferase